MPGARFVANPIIILGDERARIGRHEIPCRMAIHEVVEAITIIRPDGPTEYKFDRNILFNPGESVELDPSGEYVTDGKEEVNVTNNCNHTDKDCCILSTRRGDQFVEVPKA
ncbi:hypothetical protein BDV38DRAFT_242809 [Aspergillus pseudotamarii]|uniref:Uncharacterized protein n=1 Tax=Aspergillus pseudotamarii TaxID=132259 RepID=A0A5N6SYZ5_ASPPS|nr:uncharacterized protein BDV38DRAFT_242809 [Aspergillus pseudotamarii]KAE8139127.1 hypothetical protein BDV38DRAFT_242809 [Aspergillus pseudotamarii]